jgi:UDP-sugar transporter A1/2/3
MTILSIDPKMLSLAVLTVQNTVWVITMRISRTQAGPMYLASVAVMTDELIKFFVCILMMFFAYREKVKEAQYQALNDSSGEFNLDNKGTDNELSIPASEYAHISLIGFLKFFKREVLSSAFEFFKMAVPALCYSVQKNLLFLGVSNLDAGTFQVLSQGKILTTAMFAVFMLKKSLNSRQIMSLIMLVIGVAMVQLASMDSSSSNNTSGRKDNYLLGFFAVIGSCFTSGFASIYFEWILKGKTEQAKPKPSYDIWIRNVQLATFASSSAALGVYLTDAKAVADNGLYQGFTSIVWFVVCLQAFGGLVVALVIKYADNILKNFATSVAIVTSVIVSVLFLGFKLTIIFVIGAACVIAAVMLYTSDPKTPFIPWLRPQQESNQVEMARPADDIEASK